MARAIAWHETVSAAHAEEIERLKRREPRAWADVYEREHPVVYRAALAQVGNPAVAEDICGQVFLEALQGIGRYRDRGKPITAWLVTIARHRATDWHRRERRRLATETRAEAPDVADPSPQSDALEALQALTAEQREIVHLRFVEGYHLEEVAEMTNRTVGAVKSLQHRALARLRTLLAGERQ